VISRSIPTMAYVLQVFPNILLSTFFSLGARHDGQYNLNNCSSDERHVMAPSVGATTNEKGTNHYIFSNCSVEYFQTYINFMDR